MIISFSSIFCFKLRVAGCISQKVQEVRNFVSRILKMFPNTLRWCLLCKYIHLNAKKLLLTEMSNLTESESLKHLYKIPKELHFFSVNLV